jgi:phosphate transport system substrate-binding protein
LILIGEIEVGRALGKIYQSTSFFLAPGEKTASMQEHKHDQEPRRDPATPALITCNWCGYDANASTAVFCEVCERPLGRARVQRRIGLGQLKSNASSHLLGLGLLVLFAAIVGGSWLWQNSQNRNPAVLTLGHSHRASGIQLYPSMRDVPHVPQGIFNYGGAPFFAALAKHGMNDAIAQAHPQFRLRFAEPQNQNPGSGTGIKMLIDGELSFASSGRPIEDAEYNRAKERNLILEQVPVAIDGIVFFTHPELSISGLSVQQVQNIYLGKVKNWQELGGGKSSHCTVELGSTSD